MPGPLTQLEKTLRRRAREDAKAAQGPAPPRTPRTSSARGSRYRTPAPPAGAAPWLELEQYQDLNLPARPARRNFTTTTADSYQLAPFADTNYTYKIPGWRPRAALGLPPNFRDFAFKEYKFAKEAWIEKSARRMYEDHVASAEFRLGCRGAAEAVGCAAEGLKQCAGSG
eukprot:CAMPEP_0204330378 /NCGR_PEP_ID=MMETSP0469-20131031/14873_1 /ASSEMBLY_ACC=CAM_ASM_000384 /TAXON_ID=2969 /ORGANISM="Oxyrrhis marina" /LENGTH=169 /DNA_ID=CAMNT_0051313161 /DNA_START=10 /DNA_END=517 /DNA_ORIENTATION=-